MKKTTTTKGKITPTEVQPPAYPFYCKAWGEKRKNGDCDPLSDNAHCKKCQVNIYRKSQSKKAQAKIPKNPISDKEKEWLRWEYTQRSQKLKDQFDLWKAGKKDPTISSSKEFRKIGLKNYLIFKMLGSKSFQEWWPSYLNYKNSGEEFDKAVFPLVQDFVFSAEMERDWHRIKEEKGREPFLEEILEAINRSYSDKGRVLLIEMRNGTPEEAKEILGELKDRLNRFINKTRFRKDELNRYLKVFDLRTTGMKWKDIFLRVHPKKCLELENVTDDDERMVQLDYQKAKKLIENIEEGKFFWWSLGGGEN